MVQIMKHHSRAVLLQHVSTPECHLQGINEREGPQVLALHVNGSFVFADGAPVPKRVGVGTYHELCFLICILLSAYVGQYIEYCIRKFTM